MTKCVKCRKEIEFGERINYNDQYMCPRCMYEEAPTGSPARKQMELNFSDFLPKEKSH